MYSCEYVGRRIFYRSDVKRTKKRSAVNVFLEKEGEPCLSTDRLSLCPLEEISEIAKTESKDRDGLRRTRVERDASAVPHYSYDSRFLSYLCRTDCAWRRRIGLRNLRLFTRTPLEVGQTRVGLKVAKI